MWDLSIYSFSLQHRRRPTIPLRKTALLSYIRVFKRLAYFNSIHLSMSSHKATIHQEAPTTGTLVAKVFPRRYSIAITEEEAWWYGSYTTGRAMEEDRVVLLRASLSTGLYFMSIRRLCANFNAMPEYKCSRPVQSLVH